LIRSSRAGLFYAGAGVVASDRPLLGQVQAANDGDDQQRLRDGHGIYASIATTAGRRDGFGRLAEARFGCRGAYPVSSTARESSSSESTANTTSPFT
jgi:hypothetical protein